MSDYPVLARRLQDSLASTLPPIAVCFADAVPPGVPMLSEAAPAGCAFWERAAQGAFATAAADHELCAIGVHTHNLAGASPALAGELKTALGVMIELDYVREEEVAALPVMGRSVPCVVYAPLADTPLAPDAVLLFAHSRQGLVIAEAVTRVDREIAPAMGRPACAVVPQAVNSGRAALSLGCCGARAYLDNFSDDVALWALPGARLEDYVTAIDSLAAGNEILGKFHALRGADVAAGKRPSYAESLQRLNERD